MKAYALEDRLQQLLAFVIWQEARTVSERPQARIPKADAEGIKAFKHQKHLETMEAKRAARAVILKHTPEMIEEAVRLAEVSFCRGIRVNVSTSTRQLDRIEARTIVAIRKALTLLADTGQIIVECGRCGVKVDFCEWTESNPCDARADLMECGL